MAERHGNEAAVDCWIDRILICPWSAHGFVVRSAFVVDPRRPMAWREFKEFLRQADTVAEYSRVRV